MKTLSAALLLCCLSVFGQQPQVDKTYGELAADNALPKWATNVCFVDQSSDEEMKMVDYPWNATDHDAHDFILYGPKGDFHIQTEIFVAGKAAAYNKWDRQKDSTDASNFIAVVPASKHKDGTALNLRLRWAPTSSFYMEWTSLSSGQPVLRQQGRCEPLKRQ